MNVLYCREVYSGTVPGLVHPPQSRAVLRAYGCNEPPDKDESRHGWRPRRTRPRERGHQLADNRDHTGDSPRRRASAAQSHGEGAQSEGPAQGGHVAGCQHDTCHQRQCIGGKRESRDG